MQNKIHIFFIIIFNVFIMSKTFRKQNLILMFRKLKYDEGNRIIGNKRGTITTNDGIIINADEFEYDKNKNILQASGNISIDKINNYQISSNIIYLKILKKL